MIASRPLPTVNLREAGFVPQITKVRDKKPAHPPVLNAATESTPLHPVFGRQPHTDADLQRQGVSALFFYYWKAANLQDIVQGDEAMLNTLTQSRGAAYEAILKVKPNNATEVARQMEVITAEMQREETVAVIGVAEFTKLTEHLRDITAPIIPKKMPGKFTRGNRLTKAGLLHRYHSFLLEELYTIGWHVYGDRDFLLHWYPYDDVVESKLRDKRCRHPFFDPARMMDRAASVLKPLKIDIVNAVPERKRKGSR